MDFGISGLQETGQHLNSYSISSIGAGICLEDIYRPYLFEDSNLKLAVINVADGQIGSERLNSGIGVADFNSFRTIDLIRQFASNSDFPVQVFENSRLGIGGNCNFLVKKAKGQYVKFLFQDDILNLHPEIILNHQKHVVEHF